MSMTAQKILVGLLGLALFFSVMTVGYMDQRRKQEAPGAVAASVRVDPKFETGRKLYEKFSCLACHGTDGKTGVFNFNAQTGEQVPPVAYVADSFTRQELKEKILKGVKDVKKLDPALAQPPLYMPGYEGMMNDAEVESLIDYLNSLMPKEERDSW